MGPRRTGSDWAVRWVCAWIGYTDMDSSVRGARDGTLGKIFEEECLDWKRGFSGAGT